MYLARLVFTSIVVLLGALAPVAAQSNPGFVDGRTLCADYPNVNCPAPANPFSLNQAFTNKQDFPTSVSQAGAGAISQPVQNYLRLNAIRPQDFGTITNTAITDTPIIDAAFAAAVASAKCVYFPAGNYAYNGNGWNSTRVNSFATPGDAPCIIGDGYPFTNITLGSGKYLIDNISFNWASLYVTGLHTIGGAGVIRDRNVGVDTLSHKIVTNNYFQDYTGAAISTESSDSPFWTISDNVFHGGNSTTTVGYANCGLAGSINFYRNDFQIDKVHIKLGNGGYNDFIGNQNQFYRTPSADVVTAIWVIPQPGSSPPAIGTGLTVRDVKFGNEDLQAGDFAMLYADEGAGTLCGDKLPSFALSNGFITQHHVDNAIIYTNGVQPYRSLVYSTTPNVSASSYTNIRVGVGYIKYVLEYMTPPVVNSTTIGRNTIGPVYFDPGLVNDNYYVPFAPTNAVGTTVVIDPLNVLDLTNHNLPNSISSTANSGDYTNLLNLKVTSFFPITQITCVSTPASGFCNLGGATDTTGGGDQANYTVTGGNWGMVLGFTTTPVLELPIWLEFDMGPGGGTPIGSVQFAIQEYVANTVIRSYPIAVPTTGIRRMRFRFDPAQNAVGSSHAFGLLFQAVGNATPTTGTFSLGRLSVYQARQPTGGNVWKGVQYCEDSLSIPTVNPVGGGYLYCDAGGLKFRGSSGTVTTIAPP